MCGGCLSVAYTLTRVRGNDDEPQLPVKRLNTFNVNKCIIAWVLEFISNRAQYVFNTSLVSVTNTGAPQGCVISPVLFTLYTNDCRSDIASINPILKFEDDTAIRGLIK